MSNAFQSCRYQDSKNHELVIRPVIILKIFASVNQSSNSYGDYLYEFNSPIHFENNDIPCYSQTADNYWRTLSLMDAITN